MSTVKQYKNVFVELYEHESCCVCLYDSHIIRKSNQIMVRMKGDKNNESYMIVVGNACNHKVIDEKSIIFFQPHITHNAVIV